jgi:hypothetical protein
MYTKVGCTHICICTDVRQCTVMLKCTYSYLKKYMYLKSFFIQKYPLLIWLCIHFLQSQPRGHGDKERGRRGRLHQRPPNLPFGHISFSSTLRGRWRVVLYFFCFPQPLLLYHGRVSIPFFITDSIAQWLRR